MSDALLFEQNGPIVTLTINRPDIRNALGGEGEIDIWEECCNRINADDSVRAVILTGAGKAFSAGGDIKKMKDKSGMFEGKPHQMRQGYRRSVHRIVRAVWDLEVPVIAAVNGPAVGLGCDVTCLCDTRIAADSARFGVTFLKIGLNPGDGGAWLLPRVIGMARASELFYTGDLIDAQTAKDWGLVSRVVPDDVLMDEARSLAERISVQSPTVLRMTKKLLRQGTKTDFDTILEMSAAMQPLAHMTDDHQEALDAFFEKRAPVYSGN